MTPNYDKTGNGIIRGIHTQQQQFLNDLYFKFSLLWKPLQEIIEYTTVLHCL